MRIALLANPGSGRDDTSNDVREALRRHGADVEPFPVDDPEAAVASGPDRVVVAGGDGTVARVAAHAAAAGIPLAVVPSGTANDFARSMGIPRELEAAATLAATGRRTRRIDLGHTTARPFLNTAAAGLSIPALRRAAPPEAAAGPDGLPGRRDLGGPPRPAPVGARDLRRAGALRRARLAGDRGEHGRLRRRLGRRPGRARPTACST